MILGWVVTFKRHAKFGKAFFFFFLEVGRVGRDERGLRLYIIYLYDGYVAEI